MERHQTNSSHTRTTAFGIESTTNYNLAQVLDHSPLDFPRPIQQQHVSSKEQQQQFMTLPCAGGGQVDSLINEYEPLYHSSSSNCSSSCSDHGQSRMEPQATGEARRKRTIPKNQERCEMKETNSSITSTNGRLHVSLDEMSKYFHASQMIAARMLGVSVSTLKRRYKEVSHGKRWPYSKMSIHEKKKSLWFYINDENENETTISKECHQVLQKAFHNCTLPTSYYFSDLKMHHKRQVTFQRYVPSNQQQGAVDKIRPDRHQQQRAANK
ncbi:hypothetical protein C9374_007522 [Naegleria lovaniensis]|uniref:RWP-RK domain-containing protein n=1 Tax=Naegleria lovaniensis TaxID=51637 RepID=A0AA88GIU0_NAELO|nr:uncharacterized protein C9374_007522 [Naegleria lovaniensis]KAG2379383.1 hypothetical protein C9374_007522 [Naegleria lovaniensis]